MRETAEMAYGPQSEAEYQLDQEQIRQIEERQRRELVAVIRVEKRNGAIAWRETHATVEPNTWICDGCGDVLPGRQMTQTPNGCWWCLSCFRPEVEDQETEICEGCSRPHWLRDLHCDGAGYYWCSPCFMSEASPPTDSGWSTDELEHGVWCQVPIEPNKSGIGCKVRDGVWLLATIDDDGGTPRPGGPAYLVVLHDGKFTGTYRWVDSFDRFEAVAWAIGVTR